MLLGFEVGIVSGDEQLVSFLAEVFELERREPDVYPVGALHRLVSPGATIKVMVTNDSPAEADDMPFLNRRGIRYLTMSVEDLDVVLDRCVKHRGRILVEPFEFEPGKRIAIVCDPDGNTMEILQAN
jgi:Glyoxalase/Bleomycin resistance protein/Dioxygenase superfamily